MAAIFDQLMLLPISICLLDVPSTTKLLRPSGSDWPQFLHSDICKLSWRQWGVYAVTHGASLPEDGSSVHGRSHIVNPWNIGQPHRIKALEDALAHITGHDGVWSATGAEILAAFGK